MREPLSICFIVQAGKKYGTGHLQRCLKIAALYENPFFYIDTDSKDLSSLEALVPYPHEFCSAHGREELNKFLALQKFDAFVIDCARPFEQAFRACSLGVPAIIFDNASLGKRGDVYIKVFPKQGRSAVNFSGYYYTPIREDFFHLPEGGDGVLITLGGSDPACNALKAAAAFRDSGLSVTLVTGPLSGYPTIEPYEGLSVERNVRDLAPLFQKNSLIICGPGLTFLEALAARKRALVITHNESQYFHWKNVKECSVFLGGFFLNPKAIRKAAALATPSSLAVPEGFRFDLWWADMVKGLLQRPACCPLCGSYQKKALLRSSDSNTFKCRNCGSIYTAPLARNGENFPAEALIVQTQKQDAPHSQRSILALKEEYRRGLLILKEITPSFTASGGHRLLDIGSGDGAFVQTASDNGIKGWGLELSDFFRTVDLHNIEIFENSERAASSGPYSMITLWNNLPCTSNPLDALAYFCKFLAPGGALVFRAPAVTNFKGAAQSLFYITAQGGGFLSLRLGLKPLRFVASTDSLGVKYWEVYCVRP